MKWLIASLAFLVSGYAFGADNTLTWDDVSGEDGYTVYGKNEGCSTASLSYTPISNIPADTPTFVHTVAGDGFDWCYVVTSYNANGESGYSNEAGKVPAIPGFLKVN